MFLVEKVEYSLSIEVFSRETVPAETINYVSFLRLPENILISTAVSLFILQLSTFFNLVTQ
jgi:hypothetical protein